MRRGPGPGARAPGCPERQLRTRFRQRTPVSPLIPTSGRRRSYMTAAFDIGSRDGQPQAPVFGYDNLTSSSRRKERSGTATHPRRGASAASAFWPKASASFVSWRASQGSVESDGPGGVQVAAHWRASLPAPPGARHAVGGCYVGSLLRVTSRTIPCIPTGNAAALLGWSVRPAGTSEEESAQGPPRRGLSGSGSEYDGC